MSILTGSRANLGSGEPSVVGVGRILPARIKYLPSERVGAIRALGHYSAPARPGKGGAKREPPEIDDPDVTYRVLYASSQRLGCYLETLARFRVDLTLYAELSEIEGEDDFVPLGHVPVSCAEPRLLGSAEHGGSYADFSSSERIGLLRQELAGDCLELGIRELDSSIL